MNYNFDEEISRRGTGCVKWDEMECDEVIPLWVADMDFKAAFVVHQVSIASKSRMVRMVISQPLWVQPLLRACSKAT